MPLPPALKEAGHEIAIITPLYRCVRENFGQSLTFVSGPKVRLGDWESGCGLYKGERGGVTVWFVEQRVFGLD